jgi:hypothetical protein
MTADEEPTTACGADRDSLTGLLLAPLPVGRARKRPGGSVWVWNPCRHRRDLRESQFLKPHIGPCCNALMAAGGQPCRHPPTTVIAGTAKGKPADLGVATMPWFRPILTR